MYCNVCDGIFCDHCWPVQIPHKKGRMAPGAIPHERTNYELATKIRAILEAKMTSAEQDMLHKNDEDTTWFGVTREEAELPCFQDYGRYASIMTDTLDEASHNGADWTPGVRDHRFPSLVSFVGQTGMFALPKLILICLILERCRQEHHHQACHRS